MSMDSPRWARRRMLSVYGLIFLVIISLSVIRWTTAQQTHVDPVTPDVMGRYTYADLSDKTLPSVVTVYVKREIPQDQRDQMRQFKEFFDNPRFRQLFPQMPFGEEMPEDEEDWRTTTSGSGVIISPDGYIITSQHVVGDLNEKHEISVVLADDTEISGENVKLVWPDKLLDLALVKINRTGLTPIKWGDSDKLRIGEMVAAIGSPLDLRRTVTSGIVCAMQREVGGGLGNMIQTDAVINPGSSGGALINLDGELVGINRLITTSTGRWQGYGFAVPSNEAREFAEQVMKHGKVIHGYIGVSWVGPRQDEPKMRQALGLDDDHKGVLIRDVTEGSPAAQAGLRSGDFITTVDKKPIKRWADLLAYISHKQPGDSVRVNVLRMDDQGNPREKTVTIKVGERPDEDELIKQLGDEDGRGMPEPTPRNDQDNGLGMSLEPNKDGKGLSVVRVAPRSPAARAGVQPGDVLLRLNNIELEKMGDFNQAIKSHRTNRPHLLQFQRGGRTYFQPIEAQPKAEE